MVKPIHKFNNGYGATLCNSCRTIISIGKPTNDLYCEKCLEESLMKKNEETKVSFESTLVKRVKG